MACILPWPALLWVLLLAPRAILLTERHWSKHDWQRIANALRTLKP